MVIGTAISEEPVPSVYANNVKGKGCPIHVRQAQRRGRNISVPILNFGTGR
jgi:hypothetical protein